MTIDIPMIKYINLSGKVFYDRNENEIGDEDEVDGNVTIHFAGPMSFTLVSNSSGRFYKYVLPGQYYISLENEGFLSAPRVDSFTVSVANAFIDIEEIPEKVRVYGYSYFDTDYDEFLNMTAEASEFDNTLNDYIVGETFIEFSKKTDEDLSSDKIIRKIVTSDPNTGIYELELKPGEYDVYAYKVKSDSRLAYCNLDEFILEHLPAYEYNISLYDGRLVEGNVFYRDSDLFEVHDLDSKETKNELKFENDDTNGQRKIKYKGGFYGDIYLRYGNYTVTTEFFSEEYEMNMKYNLEEIVWIKPEKDWYTLELNKQTDLSFDFSAVGVKEIELQPANRYENVFKVEVANRGNVYNVIRLELERVPPGWYVHIRNETIPLDIGGEYSKVTTTIDLTIPVNAYAKNEIILKATPESPTEVTPKTVSLVVNTAPIYGFELDYELDLDRGIKFNDTRTFNITLNNLGNVDDELYIKFYNHPQIWNVSIPNAWAGDDQIQYLENIDTFAQVMHQDIKQQQITVQVQSPSEETTALNEKAQILVRAWSKERPDIEQTQQVDFTIRQPDVMVKDLQILNADLKDGTLVTIKVDVENKHCYAEDVNLSLYINDVEVENRTLDLLNEDSMEIVEFSWDVQKYNLTNESGQFFKIKVVANEDESFDEVSFGNNRISTRELIGELPTPEEFNWRPTLALLTLLIIFIVIYVIYRWRKKI